MNFVCKHAQEENMNSYPLIYYPDLSKHIYILRFLFSYTKQGGNEKQKKLLPNQTGYEKKNPSEIVGYKPDAKNGAKISSFQPTGW